MSWEQFSVTLQDSGYCKIVTNDEKGEPTIKLETTIPILASYLLAGGGVTTEEKKLAGAALLVLFEHATRSVPWTSSLTDLQLRKLQRTLYDGTWSNSRESTGGIQQD